jgi:hypothetical protein
MSPKRFFAGLGVTIAIQILVSYMLLQWIPKLQSHRLFIFISILVMALFCITLFFAAQRLAKSPLTRLYIQLIMIAVFIKLFVCLVLIVLYDRGFAPADNTFIWPFLFIYITSTIYEVIFLEKVGRTKNSPTA